MERATNPRIEHVENGLLRWVFDETDSTNNRAVEWLRSSPVENELFVVTKAQTAGRGRRGKHWSTADGMDLACSYARRFGREFQPKPQHLPTLNMEISLAVRDALIACSKGAIDLESLRLKWPNDLYLQATDGFRKLGGILMESHWKGRKLSGIIAGIGVNLRSDRLHGVDAFSAVGLYEATGWSPDSLELEREITRRFRALTVLEHGAAPAEIRKEYNSRLLHKDERRSYTHAGTEKTGTFLGVQPDGQGLFLWEDEQLPVAIASGDVEWVWCDYGVDLG